MPKFPPPLLKSFDETKYLYIRCCEHRYIAIWAVVVEDRVIVRSWNDKPQGWYRAFLANPRGDVKLNDKEVQVRAVPLRSAKLNDAADLAYAAKYTTKANKPYVQGLATPERRANTLELVPA